MTREQAKELLPIITAFAEGKTIQYCENMVWIDCKFEINSVGAHQWRIKPEPREFWLIDNHMTKPLTIVYSEPNERFKRDRPHCEIIHVKEVIE